MDVWTIMTTLLTGALLGFFATAGGIYLLVKIDDRKKLMEKASVYAHHFGVSMSDAKEIVKTL